VALTNGEKGSVVGWSGNDKRSFIRTSIAGRAIKRPIDLRRLQW